MWGVTALNLSSYSTRVEIPRDQPVPFSHKHHVSGLGLDCRYCHTSVETSAFAGMPPTETCITCHSQIWSDSPMLEPVRASWRNNESIRWTRVHDLPGFVYFNHSIHVNKGIGCQTCHGRVDLMPLMWKVKLLAHGLVPGLPSRSGTVYTSKERGFSNGLTRTSGGSGNIRQEARRGV